MGLHVYGTIMFANDFGMAERMQGLYTLEF